MSTIAMGNLLLLVHCLWTTLPSLQVDIVHASLWEIIAIIVFKDQTVAY